MPNLWVEKDFLSRTQKSINSKGKTQIKLTPLKLRSSVYQKIPLKRVGKYFAYIPRKGLISRIYNNSYK